MPAQFTLVRVLKAPPCYLGVCQHSAVARVANFRQIELKTEETGSLNARRRKQQLKLDTRLKRSL